MTTRFDAKDEINYGVEGVKSGYDGNKSDLFIPSCGLEDVDIAMFSLFDKELQISVSGQDSADAKKVPTIFAAGEKWALLKNGKPIRDKNNSLILPLITIMRTQVNQEISDVTSRGINQQTGEIVIKRRLDKSDRDYQNLINRAFIKNQPTAAVSKNLYPTEDKLSTQRVDQMKEEESSKIGGLLLTNRTNNVYETLVVPSPQFYTTTYEITIWTQYVQHLNQIVEKIMSSFLPQGQSWKLTTPKGYWFIATPDAGSYSLETNFDDMSSSERFIKQKFTVKVPAYVWASDAPGLPIPVKRYVSSPMISFSIAADDVSVETGDDDVKNFTLLGNDDPTLPLDEQKNVRLDQRNVGWRNQKIFPGSGRIDQNDQALKSFARGVGPGSYKKVEDNGRVKYVRIINVNPTSGETVYSATDLDTLKIVVAK